jgi:hypothetical protein
VGGEGRGRGKEGEMTQTLYAHMNKINFFKKGPRPMKQKQTNKKKYKESIKQKTGSLKS